MPFHPITDTGGIQKKELLKRIKDLELKVAILEIQTEADSKDDGLVTCSHCQGRVVLQERCPMCAWELNGRGEG